MYSYKSNIASALRKMEQYTSAVSIYKSLIPLGVNPNELFINLGTIYLEKSQPDSALYYLAKVSDDEDYNHIILENALGRAYLQKKNLTNAFTHLHKALSLHKKEQARNGLFWKNLNTGITYKLLADAERQQFKLTAALHHYQQSIIQLDYTFNDPVIYRNPPTVTGGFRNYALFESLAAKASCLKALHTKQPNGQNRKYTIETYQATLKLADYIENH